MSTGAVNRAFARWVHIEWKWNYIDLICLIALPSPNILLLSVGGGMLLSES